jgi:undecaprenyl diphosphate synthase
MTPSTPTADRPTLDVPTDRLPRHIALIMDGNGRWAQQRGLPRIEGHRQGATSVRRVTDECERLGIEQVTLFCFSSENWKRPQAEFEFLMRLLVQYLSDERDSVVERNVRVDVIGRRKELPADAQRGIADIEQATAANTGMRVCLAINYGARAELVDAVRHIARETQEGRLDPTTIDDRTIAEHLYTAGMPEPDLLIRTAGEMRVSNFLLWQISYAEIWVTDTYWPDFDVAHLHRAIRDYAARDRRFGGLSK